MFPNLEAEMARSKITQAKLADILDVTPTTMSFKLSGRSSLSLPTKAELKKWCKYAARDTFGIS